MLVLIPPALFATFDWRYQLPQLTLIPVAAVLGGQADYPPSARQRRYSSMNSSCMLRSQVSGLQAPGEPDGLAHLGQVLGAVRAAGQMGLEPAPGPAGQRAFQVAGDQLDGLLADEITPQAGVSSHLPELILEQLPEPAPAPVQQDPLVALADGQHRADLIAGQLLDVAQQDHLALAVR